MKRMIWGVVMLAIVGTISAGTVSGVAVAGEDPVVCVRNYFNSKFDPCKVYPKAYGYVIAAEESGKRVCTRKYDTMYCSQPKYYARIEAEDGSQICVMNYDQPPVANFCKSLPTLYDYVRVKR